MVSSDFEVIHTLITSDTSLQSTKQSFKILLVDSISTNMKTFFSFTNPLILATQNYGYNSQEIICVFTTSEINLARQDF